MAERHGALAAIQAAQGQFREELPQISASPTTVAPGAQVTVNGGSFAPGTVSIYLDHVGGTPLATTSGGIDGTFTVPVTIPPATTAGPHRLIAVEPGDIQASTAITVSNTAG
jgi:hypothetical protein